MLQHNTLNVWRSGPDLRKCWHAFVPLNSRSLNPANPYRMSRHQQFAPAASVPCTACRPGSRRVQSAYHGSVDGISLTKVVLGADNDVKDQLLLRAWLIVGGFRVQSRCLGK